MVVRLGLFHLDISPEWELITITTELMKNLDLTTFYNLKYIIIPKSPHWTSGTLTSESSFLIIGRQLKKSFPFLSKSPSGFASPHPNTPHARI